MRAKAGNAPRERFCSVPTLRLDPQNPSRFFEPKRSRLGDVFRGKNRRLRGQKLEKMGRFGCFWDIPESQINGVLVKVVVVYNLPAKNVCIFFAFWKQMGVGVVFLKL